MKITVTQFKRVAREENGGLLPMGSGYNGNQVLTAAGAATALAAGTALVRVGTDTAVTVDAYGPGSSLLLPAGAIEFFPVAGAQVLTFTAA